jgi:c-di-GMP-binding flagellar brake protein YcgR
MSKKEVALKIEHFYNDEDLELRITSKMEMRSILQSIAEQGSHVALFYGSGKDFILTTVLGVHEHGMWLDVGPFAPENKQILRCEKITFVSAHHHVKIQFVAHSIENGLHENNQAFYLELPDYLLRIQRREFFRTAIPAHSLVKCIIPILPENPEDEVIMFEAPVLDISGGGIALRCREHEATLLPEKIFPDCRISIPDVGTLTVTIQVRYSMNYTAHNNAVHKHVGCQFIGLDVQMNNLLQRYITRLQSESLITAQ